MTDICDHTIEQRQVHQDGFDFRASWCPRCRGCWPSVWPERPIDLPTWLVLDNGGNLESIERDRSSIFKTQGDRDRDAMR